MRRLRTRQPEATARMSPQHASTVTRFADTSCGAGPSTTLRGSLYDVEALSRLLLASAHSRPFEDALRDWRAAPRRIGSRDSRMTARSPEAAIHERPH
jgi:hypothetical protein